MNILTPNERLFSVYSDAGTETDAGSFRNDINYELRFFVLTFSILI